MRKANWMTAACLLILWAGCAPKAVVRRYYLLEAPALPDSSAFCSEPLPVAAAFEDIRVAQAFDQERIALRSGSYELSYYYYHHWAVRPSDALSDAVFHIIRNANLFKRLDHSAAADCRFILTGELIRMERISEGKWDSAHLSGEFRLLDKEDRATLLVHPFDRQVVLEPRRDMNAFADAVNRIVGEETIAFIMKISEKLNQDKAAF
ncbi:membrane integrity-associated transporter subunit PqiC [bacterium]|nr:membrane integrity-associated transporter subunit PqiC [bacterium]